MKIDDLPCYPLNELEYVSQIPYVIRIFKNQTWNYYFTRFLTAGVSSLNTIEDTLMSEGVMGLNMDLDEGEIHIYNLETKYEIRECTEEETKILSKVKTNIWGSNIFEMEKIK